MGSELDEIKQYIAQQTRNHIVFTQRGIDELSFVDVGLCVSQLLNEEQAPSDCYKEVLNQTFHHESLGQYLAIRNIGILFEPELHIDMRSVLDTYSKNQCLIVQTEAEIQQDRCFFLSPPDGIEVNLQNLSFIII